jgi:hypothetical protein
MKNTIKILAAFAVLGFAGTASAQNTAQATGTANATVISPIAITANQALDFGNIVSTVAGGTISETNGTPNYSGDNGSALSPAQAGTIEDATFTVTGQAGYTFNTTATTPVCVPNTYHVALVGAAIGSLTLAGGTNTFHVSGTLTVPAAAAAGTVTGTWTETASYN